MSDEPDKKRGTRNGSESNIALGARRSELPPWRSQICITGNHRYLGCWIGSGVQLTPQQDRAWERTFSIPNSTVLEFKVTRGTVKTEAATIDSKTLPNTVVVLDRDTVVNMVVEDWKDLSL